MPGGLSQPINRDALLAGMFLGAFFTLSPVSAAIWLLIFGIGLLGLGSLLLWFGTLNSGDFWRALGKLFSTRSLGQKKNNRKIIWKPPRVKAIMGEPDQTPHLVREKSFMTDHQKREKSPNPKESLSITPLIKPEKAVRPWWQKIHLKKVGIFFLSLLLFIQAIVLMKDGADSLSPLIRNVFKINNPFNGLGFGWLFAYIILSGSPVAAAALTFYDAGVLNPFGTLAMITGSRLGASFTVLLIGFLYVLRGRNRATSLNMGLLSLLITATTSLPALLLAQVLMKTGWLNRVQIASGGILQAAHDRLFQHASFFLARIFPDWMTFLIGLGIIMVSFKLFDQSLPETKLKESQVGWMSRLIYRPAVMFLLGGLITMISMSVSISLGILVPLSDRGFIRRENVIPYIMGANVTTFVDTLLAAILIQNPVTFTIVLVQMITISMVSLLIMLFLHQKYQKLIINLTSWCTENNQHLAVFLFTIFIIPLILIFI